LSITAEKNEPTSPTKPVKVSALPSGSCHNEIRKNETTTTMTSLLALSYLTR